MKILHLEDNPADAELVRILLQQEWADCEIEVLATRPAYFASLQTGGHDLILSDLGLPGFDGMEALKLAHEQAPDIPFVFLSGTIGEERAIEAVRHGAADYVLKDRMLRLPLAIQHAVHEARHRREQRLAEQALAANEVLLRLFIAHTPAAIAMLDTEMRYLQVSRRWLTDYSLGEANVIGRSHYEVFPEIPERWKVIHQRVLAGATERRDEDSFARADGSTEWLQWEARPWRQPDGRIGGLIFFTQVITVRKQAEQRLHELVEILDRAPVAVVINDLAHRNVYWNKGAEMILGRKAAEAHNRTAEELNPPETLAHILPARAATFEKGEWRGEVPFSTPDGRRLIVDLVMSLIRDDDGRPRARLTIGTDVTEKKKLEEQFLRAQRLESLGMLSAGIAHDLNNVLAPILMAAPLLRAHASHPADLRMLDTMEKSAERGAALVRQILTFSHGTSGGKSLLPARPLLLDALGIIEHTFPKSIALVREMADDLWPIQANPTQIHQVLLNLCVNARDAMPAGGTLRVTALNRRLGEKEAAQLPGGRAGEFVVVQVADTGTGIPAKILPRIWEPFFTTKSADRGTGLGLSTVRGIVENQQGFIELQTEAGRGTTFSVYLPAARETGAGREGAAGHSAVPRGRGELILVVDDEADIRELVGELLSRHGYRVLTAKDGVEAVGLFTPRAGEVGLVFTDLQMPNLSGPALIEVLRRLNPAVKIITTTGQPAGSHHPYDQPGGHVAAFLRKPFRPEELLAAVHQHLQEA